MRFGALGYSFSTVLSFILFTASLIAIPVLYKILRRAEVDSEEFNEKYGSMIEGVAA